MKNLFCVLFIVSALQVSAQDRKNIPYTYNGIVETQPSISAASIVVRAVRDTAFLQLTKLSNQKIFIQAGADQGYLLIDEKGIYITNTAEQEIGQIKGNKISYLGNSYKIRYPLGSDLRIVGPNYYSKGTYQGARKSSVNGDLIVVQSNQYTGLMDAITLFKIIEKREKDSDNSSYWILGAALSFLLL